MNKTNETLNAIAQTVITMMNEHGTNWTKPWKDAVRVHGQPVSAKKRAYTGINRISLGLSMAVFGHTSPVFGTFKQWKSLGANVKKGSKGYKVIFYTTVIVKDKDTDKDKALPCAKVYTVFNSDQVENWNGSWLEEDIEEFDQQWNDIEDVDQFINSIGADITLDNTNSAFYRPSTDSIHMPNKAQFNDAQSYYGTLFHELVHWTGHETREDRKLNTRFGSDKYAFEELVAELGSAMLSGITSVETTPREDHAIYLNNWMQCLKDEPKAIQKACSLAEKASQFILNSSTTIVMKEAA